MLTSTHKSTSFPELCKYFMLYADIWCIVCKFPIQKGSGQISSVICKMCEMPSHCPAFSHSSSRIRTPPLAPPYVSKTPFRVHIWQTNSIFVYGWYPSAADFSSVIEDKIHITGICEGKRVWAVRCVSNPHVLASPISFGTITCPLTIERFMFEKSFKCFIL